MNRTLVFILSVLLLPGAAFAAGDVPDAGSGNPVLCQKTIVQPQELRFDLIAQSIGASVLTTEGRKAATIQAEKAAGESLARLDQNDPDVREVVRRFRDWTQSNRPANVVWRPAQEEQGRVFTLFNLADDPHPILWVCADKDNWSANLLGIARVTHLLDKVKSVKDAEILAILDAGLQQREREYSNLLNNGFSMWPWETYLNGLRLDPSDASHPFLTQLVIMRPSAAVEVNTRSQAEANLEASLLIEPIGFVRYTSREYKHWWGASLAVTSSTREGMGLGAMVRYDNYTLGIMRHKSATEGVPDSNFLMLSMDLYNLLDSKRSELGDFKEQLGGNAKCFFKGGEGCPQK